MSIGPTNTSKTSAGQVDTPDIVRAPTPPTGPPPGLTAPGGPTPPTPPAPVTFDFVVSSMNVITARSGGPLMRGDTDSATLAINALAADNTVITQYGPITRKLGDFGNNSSTDPQMSLTGLAVPEGGSLAVSFVVVNKGAWAADLDSDAISALELAGSAVLGALAQGQIAGPTLMITQTVNGVETALPMATTAVSLPWVIGVGIFIIGALEGLNILFADCDGTVVPGALSLGQPELLAFANTQTWNVTVTYPGTDSPEGCGSNSKYAVTYRIANSTLRVTVPNVIGMSPKEATATLTAARLGIQSSSVVTHTNELPLPEPKVINQNPPAGATAYAGDVETIEISVPEGDPHHLPQ